MKITEGTRMDKKLRDSWIKALRSGKYKQGKEYLHRDQNYCCLGVLADIIDPKGWTDQGTNGPYSHNLQDEDGDELLQDEVLSRSIQTFLASMNDDGKDFNEIAEVIEQDKYI